MARLRGGSGHGAGKGGIGKHDRGAHCGGGWRHGGRAPGRSWSHGAGEARARLVGGRRQVGQDEQSHAHPEDKITKKETVVRIIHVWFCFDGGVDVFLG